jgi:hypothetical protein
VTFPEVIKRQRRFLIVVYYGQKAPLVARHDIGVSEGYQPYRSGEYQGDAKQRDPVILDESGEGGGHLLILHGYASCGGGYIADPSSPIAPEPMIIRRDEPACPEEVLFAGSTGRRRSISNISH